MDLTFDQRRAVGFFLESLPGTLKHYFQQQDIFPMFNEYSPVPHSGIWGAEYQQALRTLPSRAIRDLSLRCLENIKFNGLPSFIFSCYRSNLRSISPFCDGQVYYLLNVIENCIDFIGPKLGAPYVMVQANRVQIGFTNVDDIDAVIDIAVSDYPADFAMITISDPLLRRLYQFNPQPTQQQVNEIMSKLILKDKIAEQAPGLAERVSNIDIRYYGWGGLQIQLMGIC